MVAPASILPDMGTAEGEQAVDSATSTAHPLPTNSLTKGCPRKVTHRLANVGGELQTRGKTKVHAATVVAKAIGQGNAVNLSRTEQTRLQTKTGAGQQESSFVMGIPSSCLTCKTNG